jgi:hypothetical protein
MKLPKEFRNRFNATRLSVPDQTGIEIYAGLMKEIKTRTAVIDRQLRSAPHSEFSASVVEAIALQFRKIFELIAFASLAANKDRYSAVHSDFAKHWQAAKLMKQLRDVNPDFFPKPVVENPATTPGAVHSLDDRAHGYLTESDLIEAHGRCGRILHSANPFDAPIDYKYFADTVPVWRQKYVNLLNNHKVHLVGDTGFWLVHMQEVGHDDVSYYYFARLEPK